MGRRSRTDGHSARCGATVFLPRAMTAACRYRIVLHGGGDDLEWRALAGVFEICRPVNNPPTAE